MQSDLAARGWWRRIWIRLSLRVFMLAVLVIGGGLGWLIHRARVQREAVAAIRAASGNVFYDGKYLEVDPTGSGSTLTMRSINWEWDDGMGATPSTISNWPQWAVDALGLDYFATVTAVDLINARRDAVDDGLIAQVGRLDRLGYLTLNGQKAVTDASLAHLARLTALRDLDLFATSATGAGLKHLAGMTRLKKLNLPDGPITDADLAHLKRMTDLEWLHSGGFSPDLTDAGLSHLRRLTQLRNFTIRSPKITARGLVVLEPMTNLEQLDIVYCNVTDLTPIQHLRKLTKLNLWSVPITDAKLAPLSNLPALTDLILNDTKITDAGLDPIARLTKLETLYLDNTAVTDAGLARLAELGRLTQLSLAGTRITDAGLIHLRGLKLCRRIDVRQTAVTDAGIATIQSDLPSTHFIR